MEHSTTRRTLLAPLVTSRCQRSPSLHPSRTSTRRTHHSSHVVQIPIRKLCPFVAPSRNSLAAIKVKLGRLVAGHLLQMMLHHPSSGAQPKEMVPVLQSLRTLGTSKPPIHNSSENEDTSTAEFLMDLRKIGFLKIENLIEDKMITLLRLLI